MALFIPKQVAAGIANGLNLAIADIFGPASYTNPGGQTVNASAFGLLQVMGAWAVGITQDGLNTVYFTTLSGRSNKNIVARWFVTATGAEVANAVNLSTKRVTVLALGI